jgi:hypothetical protein
VTLKRATAACVTITSADNCLDGLHLDTLAEAQDAVGSAGPDVVAEMALGPEPCFWIVCDRCEEKIEDDECCLHFESAAQALAYALEIAGWTTDGRRWLCKWCSQEEPLPGWDVEAIPVIDGQESLL